MKTLKIITSVLSVITGVYISLALFLRIFVMMYAKTNSAASIGIIGGSDGPTTIFVTSPRIHFWSIMPIIIFLASAVINIFVRVKIRMKKNSRI